MRIGPGPEAAYRYGVVLALALIDVVFFIVAPDRPLSRSIGLVLTASMLVIVVVTGRGGAKVRRSAATIAGAVAIGVAVAVGLEELPQWVGAGTGVALIVGTIAEVVAGLARLLRVHGVTVRAVSAALTIYLLFGLLLAQLVTVGARFGSTDFFAQHTDGSQSQHIYWAFTTMTTTGYGDLTPATSYGRALAVVAMLVGQIYLVTVIALLIGNLRRRNDAAGG